MKIGYNTIVRFVHKFFRDPMHRFFISPDSIRNQHFISHDKDLCHQLSKVLKMRTGEKTLLCDNTEQEYEVEWTTISRSLCEAKILQKTHKPDISTTRAIHLFVPPLKNQARWEWMLEKGTEIGVASFTPLMTERTEVRELRKLDRLERIVKEAAEQSGRTKLPVIHPPTTFEKQLSLRPTVLSLRAQKGRSNLASTTAPTINLIATLSPKAKSLTSYELPSPNSRLFIGPVGDFTPEEIEQALEHKFCPITLGNQILRTETAALVASSILLSS